jgi:hypothetical protein
MKMDKKINLIDKEILLYKSKLVELNNNGGGFNRVLSIYEAGSVAITLVTNTKQYQIGIAGTDSDYRIYDYSGSAYRFAINGSTGYIGIGTLTPAYQLDIYAASGYTARLNGATYGGLILANAGTANSYFVGESSLLSIEHITAINLRTNNANRVRITSGGNVGIGTDSPDSALTVSTATASAVTKLTNTYNSSGTFCLVTQLGSNANNASSYHYLAATGGADKCYILGNGNLQNINNSYGQLSDIRLKKEVTKATPKLQDLLKVNIVNFKFINDEAETKQIGVIAQELEEIFPSLVEESIDRETNESRKSVKYSVFVPMLIKAIQEQQAQIQELSKQNEELSNRLIKLESK